MAKALFERVRPTCWSEVVGQDKTLRQIDFWRQRGTLSGRCIWLSGKSGTGKSSIARLIAAELCDPICIAEFNAKDVTTTAINEAFRSLRHRPLFGSQNGRALIINEAHLLRRDAVLALLTLIEDDFPDHAVVVFTTTAEGEAKFEDAGDGDTLAFLSRLSMLPLAQTSLADVFAANCLRIAKAEGLLPDGMTDDQALAKCLRLAKDNRNNHRKMLAAIDCGALSV